MSSTGVNDTPGDTSGSTMECDPCNDLNNVSCAYCDNCGYCGDDDITTCMPGNAIGPDNGQCSNWLFNKFELTDDEPKSIQQSCVSTSDPNSNTCNQKNERSCYTCNNCVWCVKGNADGTCVPGNATDGPNPASVVPNIFIDPNYGGSTSKYTSSEVDRVTTVTEIDTGITTVTDPGISITTTFLATANGSTPAKVVVTKANGTVTTTFNGVETISEIDTVAKCDDWYSDNHHNHATLFSQDEDEEDEDEEEEIDIDQEITMEIDIDLDIPSEETTTAIDNDDNFTLHIMILISLHIVLVILIYALFKK
jgi:hypothetical protein